MSWQGEEPSGNVCRGKADRCGSSMARLTLMAPFRAGSCHLIFCDLGKHGVFRMQGLRNGRNPCHNGQPCHKAAIAVSLATQRERRSLLPQGDHKGQSCHRETNRGAITVSLATGGLKHAQKKDRPGERGAPPGHKEGMMRRSRRRYCFYWGKSSAVIRRGASSAAG